MPAQAAPHKASGIPSGVLKRPLWQAWDSAW